MGTVTLNWGIAIGNKYYWSPCWRHHSAFFGKGHWLTKSKDKIFDTMTHIMSVTGSVPGAPPPGKRKEIYKFEAPWTVYSMNWSVRPDKRFRLALGSFVEEYNNKVWWLRISLRWRALKTPTSETEDFSGHVTSLTLQYLWPRPPGVWLGAPGCKPGHSGWS